MFDDISFLLQETIKDAESPSRRNNKFISSFLSNHEEDLPEEVPGFLYHLQKKPSTFVIRIYPSQNLREDYLNVKKHPDLFPVLRLNEAEGDPIDSLEYFECDRLELAKAIKSILGNKRFPIFEERVFNISDPGDSWWLKMDDQRLTILFKLSHTEDITKLVKLGPLGDPLKSMEILNQLYGYFKMLFPIDDYSCGHGQWSVSCSEENEIVFNYLKNLLITGETSHDFWEYLRRLEFEAEGKPYLESLQKANYFLMEISCIRNFWKHIEESL